MKTQPSQTSSTCVGTMIRCVGTAGATRLLPLLLLMLPAAAHAQFNYITGNGTITITGYTGAGRAVTIPETIDGLPVTSIGEGAFYYRTNLTSVSLPNSVTNIGYSAFSACTSLTGVTLPNRLITIGERAFSYCTSLPALAIPNSVTSIGEWAFSSCIRLAKVTIPTGVTHLGNATFHNCSSLASVTIGSGVTSLGDGVFAYCAALTSVALPNSVTNLGEYAFYYCTRLAEVYFPGDAPRFGAYVFDNDQDATVYHLPGSSGWGPTFGGLPTVLWNRLQVQTSDVGFGVRTNGFGFSMTSAGGPVIVVEACTSLANPLWLPLETNTLTGGSSYFSDPQWTNYPGRFYRLRSP
jgi:hypothetical protein